jgi:protein TonB
MRMVRARPQFAGAAIAAGMHAFLIVLLLQYEPVRSAIIEAAPIMVSLVTPPRAEKPEVQPKPLPVKPKISQPRAVEPPPLITSTAEAPAPYVAPQLEPEPKPLPPVEAAPPRPAVAAVPASIIPPTFNADYLDNPSPTYPAVSRRLGEHGKVVLRVLVNVKGAAEKVEIRSSSGSSRLDDAAFQAVRRWRFIPARHGDQPVAAWVLVPILFSLQG